MDITSMKIGHRFAAMLAIVFAGFVIYGASSFKVLYDLKVNGPTYQRIVQGKDLIADILPPPEYVIESYLVALQLMSAAPAERPALVENLKSLKSDYDTRRSFWIKENLEDALRIQCDLADKPTADFYQVAFRQFIPALAKDDSAAALTALDKMKESYAAHRVQINKLVEMASKRNEVDEANAKVEIATSTWIMLAILVSAIGLTTLFSVVVTRGLMRQLGGEPAYAANIAGKIAAGNLAVEITTTEHDESSLLFAIKSMRDSLAGLAQKRELLVDEIRVQSHRFEAALENMSQGLCMIDAAGNLVVSNRNFVDMLGLPVDACVAGVAYFDMLARSPVFEDPVSGTTHRYTAEYFQMAWSKQRSSRQQVWFDGRVISISHRPLSTGGFIETFEDVTELRRADARIAHMALHDPLTDLPNRVLLHKHLQDVLGHAEQAQCALLYIDLDRFKTVNDTLGHAIGDALLQQVGARLSRQVRSNDTVARLGGDEFAVLVRSCIGPAQVAALAARLIHDVSQPYDLNGHEVIIGTSIGIALAPENAGEPADLLKYADLALYGAKTSGRGRYCFFDTEMERTMRERHTLEHELRKAITHEEFEVFYQPFINLNPRRINGFEALLRWRSPTRGLIGPDDFVPLAEELGLIVPIGEWVLQQACRHAARWPDHIRVAVNLSAVQFYRSDVVETVRSALKGSGLAPHRLELEVTESLMLENTGAVLVALHRLRALGVSIAMDDFGTGYSSLSYLTMFPFDRIKIDRAFTLGLEQRPESLAVIRAVTGMCTSLGIACTAEGVETDMQLGLLDDEHCDEVQGYLFSQPRPQREVDQLLASWSSMESEKPDSLFITEAGRALAVEVGRTVID